MVDIAAIRLNEECSLTGTVRRVICAVDNGWCAVSMDIGAQRDYAFVGVMPELHKGSCITATGHWKEDPKYGLEFEVTAWEENIPVTEQGIRDYLRNGMIDGIGRSYADRIVDMFGDKTFDVLDNAPERLLEVRGIGEKRLAKIRKGWKEHRELARIISALTGCGVSPALAYRIYQVYGDQSVSMIHTSPYKLAEDVVGIGFKTADMIAMSNGIKPTDAVRINSGILFLLKERADKNGDCYMDEGSLLYEASDLLQVDEQLVRDGLTDLILSEDIIKESDRIYMERYYYSELWVSNKLLDLSQKRVDACEPDLSSADFYLDESQDKAVHEALKYGLYYITGGPGTGKTTITNLIVKNFRRDKKTVSLCAPTGRAAKRLSEATGEKAQTIHRLLETDGGLSHFKRKEDNPLDCDVLIVDECSMIDLPLMENLLKAVKGDTRVILIGDADQLPSVGPGNVLRDIISSGEVHGSTLTTVHRQNPHSTINTNAKRINSGEFPEIHNYKDGDFFYVRAKDTPEETADEIVRLCGDKLPDYYDDIGQQDIQVLTPMHKDPCGVTNLNNLLQATVNPGRGGVRYGQTVFREGDKVMQQRNDYDRSVMNGDVGVVTEANEDDGEITVRFDQKLVEYEHRALEELSLAYACTIHKSQGSEYKAVVMPVMSDAWYMWNRNLLYTGLTRAKKLCIFIGEERVISKAVNTPGDKRNTTLADRLRNGKVKFKRPYRKNS